MKHSFSKIYVGAIGLLISCSSCSDQFLQDKKDYNNMTTVDVYSDRQQATAVFATIYKQIISKYNSPLCGADPLMRQDQATGGKQYIFSEEMTGWKSGNYTGQISKAVKAGNHISNPPYWNDPRNNVKNYNNFSRFTLFPTVYVINNYIIEIDRSRSLIKDEEFWNQLKGQAIFARAWLYFDAARVSGEAFLIISLKRICLKMVTVQRVCRCRPALIEYALILKRLLSCFLKNGEMKTMDVLHQ